MVIRKLIDYFDTDKFKKMLNIFTIVVMFLYFFVSISAYAQWFPGSRKIFVFNTTSGLIIRILISIIFLFCAGLNFTSYRQQINKIWLIPFFIIIFFGLLFTFFTPTEYISLYRTTALYNFMGEMVISVSDKTLLTASLSFIVDVLFGYTFIFILPKSLKSKKFYLYFALTFMAVMLYSCLYSLVKERDYYIHFLSGEWKYNPITIGSIFGDKQQWGIYLAACTPVCVLAIYLIFKNLTNKAFKIAAYSFSVLTFALCLACSIACFCKTAIVSNILVVIALLLGIGLHLIIKEKKLVLGIVVLGILGLVLLIPTLFSAVPALKATKIGSLVNQVWDTLIERGEIGAGGRFTLLFSFLEKYPATNLMFGFNKGILEIYEYSVTPELINSLHTGIAIYFGRTGLVGLLIYVILLAKIIISICKITQRNIFYGFIFVAIFLSSAILNLSELEIIIMSSSSTVFVFNLLLVVLSLEEADQDKEAKYEKENISIVNC